MNTFMLDEIPYQNWLTTQNSVEKMKVFSKDLYSKIITVFNEKLRNNNTKYNPWMISTVRNVKFLPLVNFDSSTQIVDSIEHIKLLKSIFVDFTKETTENEKIESLLGIKFNEFDLETDVEVIQNFSQTFKKALDILSRTCPWIKEMYDTLVHQVLFIKKEVKSIRAMSTHFLKGTIIFRVSLVNNFSNLINLVVDIAHEVGHQVLMLLLMSDKIISSSYEDPVYSGVRKENRPAIKSLHSAVSLIYIISCLKGILKNLPDLEKDLREDILSQKSDYELNLNLNLESLMSTCKFTNFGSVIIREMSQNLKGV